MKMPVFFSPVATTALQPALTTAAPTNPPMSACEELDGSPQYQVSMSQMMAPISAARIMRSSTTSVLMTPLPTVLATLRPNMNAAAKLKNAAQMTA